MLDCMVIFVLLGVVLSKGRISLFRIQKGLRGLSPSSFSLRRFCALLYLQFSPSDTIEVVARLNMSTGAGA